MADHGKSIPATFTPTNATASSSASSSPFSLHSLDSIDSANLPESMTLLNMPDDAGDLLPPPAYSAAMRQDYDAPTHYGTLMEATRPTLDYTQQHPQVMRDMSHADDDAEQGERTSLMRKRVQRQWMPKTRKRSLIFAFFFFFFLIAGCLSFARCIVGKSRSRSPASPSWPSPCTGKAFPEFPSFDECERPIVCRNVSFGFDTSDHFRIEERTQVNFWPRFPWEDDTSTQGTVLVTRGDERQRAAIEVVISTGAANTEALDKLEFVRTLSSLYIQHSSISTSGDDSMSASSEPGLEPELDEDEEKSSSCIIMNILVLVKPSKSFLLDDLTIRTVTLGIEFASDLELQVRNATSLTSISGAISFLNTISPSSSEPPSTRFNSREVIIYQSTSAVNGVFPLYDLLKIETVSGEINIDVHPKAASEKQPDRPAIFELTTRTGSTNVHFPRLGPIPDREYHSHISSHTGSIKGSFWLGAKLEFSGRTCSLDVEVIKLPASSSSKANTPAPPSRLVSRTRTGSQKIHVLGTSSSVGIGTMQSEHVTRTASIDLVYPKDWAGEVDLSTQSGMMPVQGEGLEAPLHYHRHFRRGDGESTLEASSVTGSIKLDFADY